MNEGYTVIPRDEIKFITFPFLNNGDEDFNTGEIELVKGTRPYPVFAYKYAIREDIFEDDIVTFDLIFYLGTRYFPRKTSGCKYSSTILSIQFTIKVDNKEDLKDRMWDYVYSIERRNAEQLLALNYKTYFNNDLQSEEEKDVIEIFKTIGYIG